MGVGTQGVPATGARRGACCRPPVQRAPTGAGEAPLIWELGMAGAAREDQGGDAGAGRGTAVRLEVVALHREAGPQRRGA